SLALLKDMPLSFNKQSEMLSILEIPFIETLIPEWHKNRNRAIDRASACLAGTGLRASCQPAPITGRMARSVHRRWPRCDEVAAPGNQNLKLLLPLPSYSHDRKNHCPCHSPCLPS